MNWWLWLIVAYLGLQLPLGILVGRFLSVSCTGFGSEQRIELAEPFIVLADGVYIVGDSLTHPQLVTEMSGAKSHG